MTGFGMATAQINGSQFAVELRSLNNRYFKAVIRLPESIGGLEAELEVRLRSLINRGSVTLWVKVQHAAAGSAGQINQEALEVYLKQLRALEGRLDGGKSGLRVDLASLLTLPGVMGQKADAASEIETSRPILHRLLDEAYRQLNAMRAAEGKALAADLAKHHVLIRERLETIRQRAPQVIDEYHQRLRTRIDELLARAQLKVSEVDLIREVAIYAERCDISEELMRLTGHMDQFDRIVAAESGQPAGRTLEFLAQEMLREANTIASKSNDGQISQAIVDVKGAIDRIKEQTQNVE